MVHLRVRHGDMKSPSTQVKTMIGCLKSASPYDMIDKLLRFQH